MPGELGQLFENQEELKDPVPAEKIVGTIPNWINGTYIRVGPGMFDLGKVKLDHFIDGYSMLSKVDIKDGQVKMHKRFLRSEAYKKAMEQKEPFFPEFGTPGNIGQQKSFFRRLISAYSSVDVTDNESINIFKIGNDLFASSETMHITSIKPENLETTDLKVDYSKVFNVHMVTPHALVDSNGDWYNMGTSFSATGAKYNVMKIPNFGKNGLKDGLKKASVITTFSPSSRGYVSYFHTFGMTENYILFVEQPWIVSEIKLIDAKLKGKCIQDLFYADPKALPRFYIINKKDGKVFSTKFYAESSFFFFHFANVFEDGDTLVADMLNFPDASILSEMAVKAIVARRVDESGNSFARVHRYAIPVIKTINEATVGENLISLDYTTAKAVRQDDKIILQPQIVGESGLETPDINPMKRYSRHRYIYGSGLQNQSYFQNSLAKVDMETGEVKTWKEGKHLFPGDPKFIPKPGGTAEDEGVLVAAVADMSPEGKDFLLFLNPSTMEEEARAVFGSRLPQSIHSLFLKNE